VRKREQKKKEGTIEVHALMHIGGGRLEMEDEVLKNHAT
jgi:hypothetical protein